MKVRRKIHGRKYNIIVITILLLFSVHVAAQDKGTVGYDADGTKYIQFDIMGPTAALDLELTQSQEVQEYNTNTGAIQIQPSGGWSNYVYFLYKNNVLVNSGGTAISGPTVISNLGYGTYKVELRDSKYATTGNECNRIIKSITLSNPEPLTIRGDSQAILCNGQRGTITAFVKGGLSPSNGTYTVNIYKDGSATALKTQYVAYSKYTESQTDFVDLLAGNYKIEVKDKYNVTKTATLNLSEPTALVTPTVTSFNNVSCKGGNDGTITVSMSGGTPPYTLLIDNNPQAGTFSSTKIVSGLRAQGYTLKVVDDNKCESNIIIKAISEPTQALSIQKVSDGNPTFASASDGFINISVTGGTAPYSYEWFKNGNTTPFTTTQNTSNLGEGIYKVVVTDAKGCPGPDNFSITLTDPEPLDIQLSKTDVKCFGAQTGSVSASVVGGASSTYTYKWYKKTGGVWNLITGTTSVINNLPAGEYKANVSVIYNSNIVETKDSGTITISQPISSLSIGETIKNVSCKGGGDGAIVLNVSGGTTSYSYVWSNDETTRDVSGLSAGSYTVTVTDSNNCVLKRTYTVTEPMEFLSVEYNSHQDATANSNDIDALGLTPDGSITVQVSGGTIPYSYQWFDGLGNNLNINNATIPNIKGGDYKVLVTDAKGCTEEFFYTIFEPEELIINVEVPTDGILFCNNDSDGKINATVTGGVKEYTYHWYEVLSDNSKSFLSGETNLTVQGLSAGRYGVEIKDNGGNGITKYSETITLVNPTEVVLDDSKTVITDVSCKGGQTGAIELVVTGGTGSYKYAWFKSSNPTSPIANTVVPKLENQFAGVYIVKITDDNNCPSPAIERTITINEPLLDLKIDSGIATDATTFGVSNGEISVVVSGGTAPYRYELREKGNATVLKTTNPATGLAGSISGIVYEMTVIDSKNCITQASYTVQEPAAIGVSLSIDSEIACYNGEGTISSTVSGGFLSSGSDYTYQWYNVTDLATVIGTTPTLTAGFGTYKLEVTDSNGNKKEAQETLVNPTEVVLDDSKTVITDVSCKGGQTGAIEIVVTGGTGSYKYAWFKSSNPTSPIANTVVPKLENQFAGVYIVKITDDNNCPSPAIERTITINEPLLDLKIDSGIATDATTFGVSNGEISVVVSGGTAPYRYELREKGNATVLKTTNPATGLAGSISGIVYEMTVIDSKNCITQASYTVQEPAALGVSLSIDSEITCYNGEGTISSTVSGGFLSSGSDYTYQWYNVTDLATVIGTTPTLTAGFGTYKLEVTDSNGNKKEAQETLVNPTEVVLDDSKTVITDVSCKGDQTGAIELVVTGGTGSYKYAWFKSSNPTSPIANTIVPKLENQFAGVYIVKITDDNNCPSPAIERTITINEPLLDLKIDSGIATDATTFGVSNGEISVVVSGGTAPYRYELREKGNATVLKTTNPATGLAGSISGIVYEMTVIDSKNCITQASYTVQEPAALGVSLSIDSEITCYNGEGTISSTVSGGFLSSGSDYTYQWYNVTDLPTVIGTTPTLTVGFGTYKLEVTDSNGNKKEAQETLVNPTEVVLDDSKTVITDVSCKGGQTGAIELVVTGGTGSYKYAWFKSSNPTSPIANTVVPKLENQFAGVYIVKITDDNNCPSPAIERTITIREPAEYRIANIVYSQPSGAGNSDGSISLDVLGGSPPYIFKWTDNNGVEKSTTKTVSNIPAGDYMFQVIDSKGCALTDIFVLGEPKPLIISISQVATINCHGEATGVLELTSTGGVGGNTYTWYNATTGTVIGNSEILNNLPAGSYYVKVVDANGVEATSSVYEITQPTLITATASHTNLSCFESNDGKISIEINGGVGNYEYQLKKDNGIYGGWISTSSNIILEGLSIGTYSIQIKDGNGCLLKEAGLEKTFTFELTQPEALTIEEVVTNVSGFGLSNGQIDVTVTGGTEAYVYEWKNESGTVVTTTEDLLNVVSGTYTLTITDAQSCSLSKDYTITQPDLLTISITQVEEIYCNGEATGVLELTSTGGAGGNTYTWYNATTGTVIGNSEILNNLPVGSYYVKVVDINFNEATSSVYEITQPTLITATASHTNLSCFESNDGEISIEINGGVGNYEYQLKKDNGIYGGWISTSSNIILEGLSIGTYSIQIKDGNGCLLKEAGLEKTFTFELTQPEALTIEEVVTNVSGFGLSNGQIDVTVTGGTEAYVYEWKNESGTIVTTTEDLLNVVSGTYTLTITDAQNCSLSKDYTITQPNELEVTLNQDNIVLCKGYASASIKSTVSGGVPPYQYKWYEVENTTVLSTANSLTNIGIGSYYVVITDANNNTAQSAELIISEPQVLQVFLQESATGCGLNNDWTITANVVGGTPPYNYEWSSGHNTAVINNISLGSYFVLITDANGCQTSENISLQNSSPLTIKENIKDVICYDSCSGEIELTIEGGVKPYQINWNTGQTGSIIRELCAGTYTATVTDQKGCQITKDISIQNAEEIIFEIIPNEVTLCYGETIEYDVTMDAITSYSWTSTNGFTSNESVVLLSEEGVYTITITTVDGCKISREITIYKSDVVIDAQILITSQAFVGEDVVLINVSNPISEKVTWEIPSNVTIVQQTDEGLVLRFPAPGDYDISLISTEGNCKKVTTKTVTVLKARNLTDVGDAKKPFIKEFMVYSNPNKGQFKVDIELEKEAEISLRLFSLGANSVIADKLLKGKKEYEIPYDMNVSAGVYVLLLETPKAKRIQKVIIE
ncbi:hypothetical protein P8625_02355 [Tenacibaculum tangerinum]|uniref:Ig-like domain-containing protein n=1 Tax=Tenacibaculum tangerinum TaxID=3038772 RepID=A0ABY8L3L9_9FLAO|nr:hypothetical protein [Tenacibaculum tangerinum]WGH76031.1 hypothetical protein P8625_02355 [Tenacibaculum tangerinum]